MNFNKDLLALLTCYVKREQSRYGGTNQRFLETFLCERLKSHMVSKEENYQQNYVFTIPRFSLTL
jgi:hypothetical protein